MFLMSSHVEKQLNYMMIFYFSLFHFFYFIFSAPILFSFCSPISPSLPLFFFFGVLSQGFIKCGIKAFVYIYIYFRKPEFLPT